MKRHIKQVFSHKPSRLSFFGVVGVIVGIIIFVIILPNYLAQQAPGSAVSRSCTCLILSGYVPSEIISGKAKQLGPHNPNDSITLSISLALRNKQALSKALLDHQTITNLQQQQLYDPTHQQAEQVVQWLQSYGFTTPKIYSTFILITTKGTIRQAEHMLHVQINDYQLGNTRFFSPSQDPEIDKSLGGIVLAIVGLDNLSRFHTGTLTHLLMQ